MVHTAVGHSGYVVLALAFFVCGLQIVFITTHRPNYLSICGRDASPGATALAIIGFVDLLDFYAFGRLGDRYPKQFLPGGIYVLRSVAIALYFSLPVTPLSTMVFAAAMGSLRLGVVPLVNGLVAQLFGLRFMATLTGIALSRHQAGSFSVLGAAGLSTMVSAVTIAPRTVRC